MTEYNLKERIKNFVLWPKSKVVLLNTWNWKLGWIYVGETFAGWNFRWVKFSLGGIFVGGIFLELMIQMHTIKHFFSWLMYYS